MMKQKKNNKEKEKNIKKEIKSIFIILKAPDYVLFFKW
jgi:hypothetical protein